MTIVRHALVTGSSTGIGLACVTRLAARGWVVFAGVRRAEDGEAVKAAAGGAGTRVRPLIVDVADRASVDAAVAEVAGVVGEAGLAGLVNNAGISVNGPMETIDTEGWRRQFEVNLFGPMAVTRGALPLLRAYAQAGGGREARIVMMSSIAGRVGQPIIGPYCASKHALEGASDALRLELAGQGVGVSLVEPGAVKSELWRKAHGAVDAMKPEPALERYSGLIRAISELATKAEKGAVEASVVAAAVERCLTTRRAPTRVLVGRDAKIAALNKWLLPDRVFDTVLTRVIGVGRKR